MGTFFTSEGVSGGRYSFGIVQPCAKSGETLATGFYNSVPILAELWPSSYRIFAIWAPHHMYNLALGTYCNGTSQFSPPMYDGNYECEVKCSTALLFAKASHFGQCPIATS